MKRNGSLVVSFLLLSAANAHSLPGNASHPIEKPLRQAHSAAHTDPSRLALSRNFGSLPLSFEPNQGQADRSVRFLSHSVGASLSLASDEAVFQLPASAQAGGKGVKAPQASRRAALTTVRMQLLGAANHAASRTEQLLPGHVNYFTSRDPKQWHTDIPTFGKVGFQDVYPGVDVVYYGNQQHLEYDFVVAPHADPQQIALRFTGAEQVRIDRAGDLIVKVAGRELTWQKPTVYQQNASGKQKVGARFRLKHLSNGQTAVQFALGSYDASRPLVIDPVLTYSSRLQNSYGGGPTLAVDSSGSVYLTGTTLVNEFEGAAYVTKLNPTGTAVVYTTNLGTTPLAYPPAIAVDSSGSAYVTGAGGGAFPVTAGAYSAPVPTGFVAKLNPTGDSVTYSAALGAIGSSIALDSTGNAYITGHAAAGMPTTPGAFQPATRASGNNFNAFVTKLNPTGTALVYSTYLGGSTDRSSTQSYSDSGHSIVVDSSGNAYVTGITDSSDFPTTPGVFLQGNYSYNTYISFVTKLNPTGTGLVYSSYLGTSNLTSGNGIVVDSSGNAYVVGGGGGQLGYVGFWAKINPTATRELAYKELGAYLGIDFRLQTGDYANAIAIDSSANLYIAGRALSTNFPTTVGSFQRLKKSEGHDDAYVMKLTSSGSLIYSTLLGGTGVGSSTSGSIGMSVAVDNSGNVYTSGYTVSSDFPTTPGAYNGGGSAFVTKLFPIPIFPDFNNDGYTDLFFQNSSTGAIVSWFMQGATRVGGASFSLTPPSDYAVVGVGDFLGNGATSILLQNRTTNQVAQWFTSGTDHSTINAGHFLDTTPVAGWKVVGVGDFNQDGRSDIVYQNQTTGRIALWFMNGFVYQGGVTLDNAPDTGWLVVGIGDFNGDGWPDIAFQNQTTGQIALWFMNYTTRIGGTVLTNVPDAGWKVVGVGDYNGDGMADLLFQNQTTNQAAVWYLQNGVRVDGATLSATPQAGWKIVGPR